MKKIILLLLIFFGIYSQGFAETLILDIDASKGSFDDSGNYTPIFTNSTDTGDYFSFSPGGKIEIPLFDFPENFRIETKWINLGGDFYNVFDTYNPTNTENRFALYHSNSPRKYNYVADITNYPLYVDSSTGNSQELTITNIGDVTSFSFGVLDNFFGENTSLPLDNVGGYLVLGNGYSGLLKPVAIYYFRVYDLGTGGVCTTETIPSYTDINIQPTSTGAITEYIEDPATKTYAYSTSLSGDNPLQVIALGIDNENGFSDFSYQNGPFKFKTENRSAFSDDKTYLAISSKNGIQYVKMLGDYGKVDVVLYREDNKTISYRRNNVDVNSFNTGYGFPIGGSDQGQLVFIFKNSFFEKTIDTIEIYSIGSDTTREVEICYNETEDTYTVDGEEYYEGGNPYVDLVGDPELTETNLYNDGYTFFENGFCLRNFAPFPSGGELYFQIRNPKEELKITYSLYATGLQRYGNNTCTAITTNYHNVAGKYYVKGYYKYKGVVYEINENFTQYNITTPEYISDEVNPWADEVSACGVKEDSTGFLPGVSRFFACITQTISQFFSNQYQAVKQVGSFILKVSDVFTTEVKDFSFILGVHASEPLSTVMNFTETQDFKDSPYGKIKQLLWGAIAVMVLVVCIWIFILIKQND